MTDIQWDSRATLMRVITFDTTEPQEELLGQGTLMELVGAFLEMAPQAQEGVLLRAAGPDWLQEFGSDEIRELAARPEFTGATGDFDTATLAEDPDTEEEIDTLVTERGSSPGVATPTDADLTSKP